MNPDLPDDLERIINKGLEKDRDLRYQSAAEMRADLQRLRRDTESQRISAVDNAALPLKRSRRLLYSVGSAVLLAGTASGCFYLARPLRPLTITEYVQLTHTGDSGTPVATDGARLYLYSSLSAPIRQVSVSGGEMEPVTSITTPKTFLDDVSPDGSTLLTESYAGGFTPVRPFYSVQVLGGAKRYLGDFDGARWSPDGKRVFFFSANGDISVMQSDGTGARKLASPGGRPDSFIWMPDGKTIRFSRDKKLWEMDSPQTFMARSVRFISSGVRLTWPLPASMAEELLIGPGRIPSKRRPSPTSASVPASGQATEVTLGFR